MKLATLAEPIKAAYRQSSIDTATAEAFASVPPDRQLEVWQEVGGNPQHAQHVRSVIAHAWIDAAAATFNLATLPESAISKDLFGDKVLVERKVFMEAQAEALLAQRQALAEDGWAEVVIGPRGDVQDRLYSMSEAPKEYDEATTAKLKKLSDKREKSEAKFTELDDDNDPDDAKSDALTAKLEALDTEEGEITKEATVHYAEATKAVGSVFLILDPDGRVRQEFRMPRYRPGASANGNGHAANGTNGATEAPKPPTADDLKEPQLAITFTHQALCVREALLKDTAARRRVLALILHDKVRSEALAIRHEANGTTLHADHGEGFDSSALDAVRQRRAEVDPLRDQISIQEDHAYTVLAGLPDKQVNALIDVLTVECVMAHLQRRTELVWRLAGELDVDVRKVWRPDERWLSSFQKIQLASLIVELRGAAHAPAESKKKSELVSELARLFTDAAEGRMEDAKLAAALNAWLPSNLRDEPKDDAAECESAV
jgi:hypothetical protein